MTFRTGHIDDHPEVVKRRLGIHLHPEIGAMRAGALPLKSTNRAKLIKNGGPGILNQNDTGSCEGHAHASGLTLKLALAGTPLTEVISPVGLYLGALMVDRGAVPTSGKLPPLTDSGTMPSSIQTASQTWGSTGASVWGQYPASSGTMYVTPSDPNSALIEPTPEKLYAESAYRLKGMYFVQSTGLQKVIDILTVLAAGNPVSDAIPASGQDFQGYAGGVLSYPSGAVDHANLVVDYEWTGTQEQFTQWLAGAPSLDQYLIGYGVNSWGTSWGEADAMSGATGGTYQFNRSFFDGLQDAAVLDVVKAS
jgi:hypothetical protein